MSGAYYNEIDPFAAQWLRNLIRAGHLPEGEVDERSIRDVHELDLIGFVQCHFFAGIGGWPFAARLAGWPDDRPLWTGSCPCQPFSVAGKRRGEDDPRHLWPDFFYLIRAARPVVVMGEQVAGAAGYGWLDGVVSDLAREGYACRGVDIPASAVDAPHIRSRLYWVAQDVGDADNTGLEVGRCGPLRVADPQGREASQRSSGLPSVSGDVADADGRRLEIVGLAQSSGFEGARGREPYGHGKSRELDHAARRNGTFWSDHVWLAGADGKARRAQPGLPLLAHGIPGRVGRLRAYGNAIVPQLAAEVIAAFMECVP